MYKSKKNNKMKYGTMRGGSKDMFDNVIKMTNILENKKEVQKLIEKIFGGDKIKYFTLDGSIPDPFIKIADNADFNPLFYIEWYRSKNPEFKTHDTMETEGLNLNTNIGLDGTGDSIYETVIAQICRDILIMLYTGKRNKNNNARNYKKTLLEKKTQSVTLLSKLNSNKFKDRRFQTQQTLKEIELGLNELEKDEKDRSINLIAKTFKAANIQSESDLNILDEGRKELTELLSQCDTCIKEGYIYKNVFNLIINYAKLCSNTKFKKLIEEYATKLCATPYLLFPTYGQISFSYVLNLVAAPIINFRLVNRRRKIHGSIGNSFYEIQHDVFGHGRDTHKLDVLQDKYYKEWFNNISIVISTLFPFYNYKLQPYFRSQLKTQYVELDEEEKKYIMAILLFILIHENLFGKNILYTLFFKFNDVNNNKGVKGNKYTIFEGIYNSDEWPKHLGLDCVKEVITKLHDIFVNNYDILNTPMWVLFDFVQLLESEP
jgi:hypothetical protein